MNLGGLIQIPIGHGIGQSDGLAETTADGQADISRRAQGDQDGDGNRDDQSVANIGIGRRRILNIGLHQIFGAINQIIQAFLNHITGLTPLAL